MEIYVAIFAAPIAAFILGYIMSEVLK